MIHPVRCLQRHQSTYLSDVINRDGSISHLCGDCQREASDQLVLVNLVRLLFKRSSELTADERKESGT